METDALIKKLKTQAESYQFILLICNYSVNSNHSVTSVYRFFACHMYIKCKYLNVHMLCDIQYPGQIMLMETKVASRSETGPGRSENF